MSPINVGFIGLSSKGWASSALAPTVLALKDKYSITAVSTTSEKSATESAKHWSEKTGQNVKAYFGPTTAISADPNIDLVAVSVKVTHHKEVAVPALEAGKNLFIEWPAGRTLAETEALAQLAKQKGVKTHVGFQGRHAPYFRKLKELLGGGAIGKVISSSMVSVSPREVGFWGPTVKEFAVYAQTEDSGATMPDIAGGHLLDGFLNLLGPVQSVVSVMKTQFPIATIVSDDDQSKPTGRTVNTTAPDQIAFAAVLQSGAVSSFHWRVGLPLTPGPTFTWIIDGETGSLKIEGEGINGAFTNVHEPKLYLNGELVSTDNNNTGNIGRAWSEFADGNESYATLDDAVKVKRVLDAVYRSAKEGKRIDLQ